MASIVPPKFLRHRIASQSTLGNSPKPLCKCKVLNKKHLFLVLDSCIVESGVCQGIRKLFMPARLFVWCLYCH